MAQPKYRLSRFLTGTLEFGAAAVLVFLFFLTFLAIISFSFPQGQSLRNLMVHRRWTERPVDPVAIEGKVTPQQTFVAELVSTKRQVKTKNPRDIVWNNARQGMGLGNRYSVQTLDRSGATITFSDRHELSLGEKSLVLIRERKRRHSDSSVAFDGWLDPGNDDDNSVPYDFVAPNGATAWLTDADSEARLRMTVNADKTATFALDFGEGQVSSGGVLVRLPAGFSVTADGVKPPQPAVRVPDSPLPTVPASGSSLIYRSTPPPVHFGWTAQPAGNGYRIEIARDPHFSELIHEQRVEVAEFTHGNLPEGALYWRVSAFHGWAESPPSKPMRLEMVRDLAAPALEVEFPAETIRDARVVLRGTTEPGARLFIDGWSTVADADGTFEHTVELRRGVNVVVVEAVDIAGNATYRSELVNAKY